jgi:hypothetical protein
VRGLPISMCTVCSLGSIGFALEIEVQELVEISTPLDRGVSLAMETGRL